MIHRSFPLILGTAVVAWTSTALAVCLNGHPSLQQEYQRSTTVFVGRVVSEDFTPESKNYLDGTTYSVQVEEVLRGSPAKTVKLFPEYSSGRFPMQVGATYLIFVYEESDRLNVDNCGNSGKLPEKAEALAALRAAAIEAQIGTWALHRLGPYQAQGPFPGADRAFERALALPFATTTTEAEVERVTSVLTSL